MKIYKDVPKQYIGLITDHSMSMSSIKFAAMADYNTNIESICAETNKHQLDTIIYSVLCGIKPTPGVRLNDLDKIRDYSWPTSVQHAVVNSTVGLLKPLTEYDTSGSATPLYDAVGDLIEIMEKVPDYGSPNVSFLVLVVTDGQENCSKQWKEHNLSEKISSLQSSDRWTFTFRVPKGASRYLAQELNIPIGNFYEWDTTKEGMERSTVATAGAVASYYTGRSAGKTSTSSFFTNVKNLKTKDVKKNLDNITDEVTVFSITERFHDAEISEFIKSRRKFPFVAGNGFYELTKREKIQNYKKLVLQDLASGKFYSGNETKTMLGLPSDAAGTINVKPGDHGKYKIFVQSTSTNRKLKQNTKLVWWNSVR